MKRAPFKVLRKYVRDLKESEVEDREIRRELIEDHLSCSPRLYRNNLSCKETKLNSYRLISKQKRFARRTGSLLSNPYMGVFVQDNPQLWGFVFIRY